MKLFLVLLAALGGWFFLLRPWLSRRDGPPAERDPRFRGQDVQEADFEELDPEDRERKQP